MHFTIEALVVKLVPYNYRLQWLGLTVSMSPVSCGLQHRVRIPEMPVTHQLIIISLGLFIFDH